MGIQIDPGNPTLWICPQGHEKKLIGVAIGLPTCSKCKAEMVKEQQ